MCTLVFGVAVHEHGWCFPTCRVDFYGAQLRSAVLHDTKQSSCHVNLIQDAAAAAGLKMSAVRSCAIDNSQAKKDVGVIISPEYVRLTLQLPGFLFWSWAQLGCHQSGVKSFDSTPHLRCDSPSCCTAVATASSVGASGQQTSQWLLTLQCGLH